ncbi:hypothetical protein [Pseudomonas alloputida]|uniref:hypothetical protein n=1 Tax=Pseudomonas TaxID=286 RepID=UPI003EE96CE8
MPIFIVAAWMFLLPAGDFSSRFENFIDLHLFGRVGPWSSRFPLDSKVIANYVVIAAPIVSLVLILHWRKHRFRPAEPLLAINRRRFVLLCCSIVAIATVSIYYSYFSYLDASAGRSKYRIFGESRVLFPVFAAMFMVMFEYSLLAAYLVFIHYPLWLLAQRRASH